MCEENDTQNYCGRYKSIWTLKEVKGNGLSSKLGMQPTLNFESLNYCYVFLT